VILKLIKKPAKVNKLWNSTKLDSSTSSAPFKIYNVSNGIRVTLKSFLKEIEKNLNKKARIRYLPLQKGDIQETLSNTKLLDSVIKIRKSKTDYREGVKFFIKWYLNYYKKKNG
jgi:UDP-glucuronate 4-epimerase